MSFKLKLIAAAISAAALMPQVAFSAEPKKDVNNIMQAKIEPFTSSDALQNIKSYAGSKVSLSDLRSISGKTSLEWDWTAGSSIVFNKQYYIPTDKEASETWGRRATALLSFFIYNETPIDDYLVVDVGQGVTGYNNGDAGFKVKLNFKGWRAIGVSLSNDIEPREKVGIGISDEDGAVPSIRGTIGSNIDSIRFMAPRSVKQGRFFIDHIMLSVDDARYQWADDHVQTRIVEPEIKYHIAKKLPKASPQQLQQDVKLIKQRFTDALLGISEDKMKEVGDISVLEKEFNALNIKKSADGVITGRHILTGKQKDRYQVKFLSAKDKALFDQYVDLSPYAELMYNISKAYVRSTNPAVRQKLANMYLLMTEHLMDQGFEKGSGLITTHHWGYSSRWWYLSAFLMEDVLDKAGLKKPIYDALLWYSREFRESFNMLVKADSSNLDYFNTLSRQHLALLLLENDPQQLVKLVNSYAQYISGAIAQTPPGDNDGFRPDGTTWRHNGHYPGYGFPALPNATQLALLFKGTAFEFDKKAFESLKRVLFAAWVYTNPNTGIGLSGRHPFKTSSIESIKNSYKWLALAAPNGVDEELAAIYLTLANKSAKESAVIFGKEIVPAKLPQGFWSYNGGAFGIHRFGDKMVTLKAFNSNVWSSEIYYAHNRYGRYQSNGSAQILSHKAPDQQGFNEEGWDWNRLPGVTSIHLPLPKLDSPMTHTLMLRGTTPYSGTSALSQQYGMMMFDLGKPNRSGLNNFDDSFRAKKSALTGDDHLIFVGTNINSSDSNKNVETALFQLSDKSSSDAIFNGSKITKGNKQQFKTGDWIIDGDGNGYLITNVESGYITKQNQESAMGETRKKTNGVFSSAWIDHSVQPSNAYYEYMVFLDATPAKMQSLAADVKAGKMPYAFKQEGTTHIIKDHLTNVSGYAFYQSGSITDDIVISSDKPSIVMVKNNGNEINISGVTPNLNIDDGKKPKPINVTVNIKGNWKVTKPNENVKVSSSGNTTRLTFSSYFGIPQEVQLTK
ncbi:chondroitin-sulfate-ABC endolyase/exolyase [Pasteurella langaaensis DSM 22999]|uniref:Chondroitin sulfate ABC lyase n=1 Tax=Alitibacter langaaensis DSM 22999 TaxID=1122935 RepID=A0A2U0TAF1_9PAST|nr:chondroitinase family polysaccharide lyase [Pasteurella langaaensis]PVX40592.1 chondroitin-sulfate-ABC endolyase/exolyase [Pasteurella langaaensis DSM 22999]